MARLLTAIYQKVPEGYIGFVKELPGANTQGDTLEETRRNLHEAVELMDELMEHMMTIAMARLVVRTEINRLARLEPDEARDLERAIHTLIDDAVASEIRRIGLDVLGESASLRPRSERGEDEGG